ncbi:MAG: 50S ribosomal protein L25/general stress protein Ctc [Desulfobacteraceae bacterium]|nr:MAG: 50S ribosomal protein L25/general stress protein Ctc [Desulfobacteraceae bacterium]
MEILELKAEKRNKTGKGPAHSLRRDGMVPAVLYGPDTQPVSLSVQAKEIETLLKNAKSNQQLINIDLGDGAPKKPTMIKEMQRRPVKGGFLHIDFYEVAMDRKIRARVPVVVKGKCIGVENGGLLQIIRRELEVLCYPAEIPETIELDITNLEVGHSIHVNDIHLEGDMEIPAEVNFTVITILAPKREAVETGEEGVEEAVAAEEAPAAE